MATLPPVCAVCVTLWSKSDNARHHNKTKETPFSEKGREAGRPWPPGPAGRCWERPPTISTDINEHSDKSELQKVEKRFDFTVKHNEIKEADILYKKMKKILFLKWNKKTAGQQIYSRTVQTVLVGLWMFVWKLCMESIITATNPSLFCEQKRSKLCFTEAKVTQTSREESFSSHFSVICL